MLTQVADGDVAAFAQAVRARSLRLVHQARSSHIGSCLSMADILAVLYRDVLRVKPEEPAWPDRDRLIVSKGHAAAAVYGALAEAGFLSQRELDTFGRDGSLLAGHVTHGGVPGVEVSTGSLGHGLSIGVGMALAAMRSRASWRVYVVLSDGECDEGSTWEALMFAGHHRLTNLTAIIDYNGIQSLGLVEDTLRLEPIADKLRAFGWGVHDVPGHDIPRLRAAIASVAGDKPTAVIARTVKGKGVPFMEGDVLWHYRPPDDEDLRRALQALGVQQ